MRINYVDNIDSNDGIKHIPDKSVDLVVTDPPYLFSQASSAGRKIDPWADWCNASYWYASWFSEVRRVLKNTGAMWTFLNWRSLVTFQKAACSINWPIESLLVWDKEWIGPGGTKGLRPSYELCALFCMPDFSIPNRGIPDIRRCKWSSNKPHGHPAEKPEALVRWIIEQSSKEGDVVLDMFVGSGTTPEACIKSKRNYIGFEMNPEYHKIAINRIIDAENRIGMI